MWRGGTKGLYATRQTDATDFAHPVLHVESLRNTCSPPLPGGARTSPGIVGIFQNKKLGTKGH